jgi:hypothetical protein
LELKKRLTDAQIVAWRSHFAFKNVIASVGIIASAMTSEKSPERSRHLLKF